MRGIKRSLWLSALSLCLCVAMLLGTTFAWFTDSVVNKNNRIEAGSLQVELWKKGPLETTWTNITESQVPVFNYDKWEPGYSTGATFRVENKGTLSVKYELELQNVVTTKEIENVIDVYVNNVNKGTLAQFMKGENLFAGTIVDGTQYGEEITVKLEMQTGADNDYQSATAKFDILLKAAQTPDEADGFGSNKYDEDALYEQINVEATNDENKNGEALQDALREAKSGTTIFVSGGVYNLPAGTESVSGQSGWLMPITQDGITIKGDGNTVIKSDDASGNGAWATQNVITVFADNVTLENLIIEPRASVNKNVEVLGKNFTMKNCTVRVGSLYFSGDKGNVLVSGNTFEEDSCIVLDSVNAAETVSRANAGGNIVIENNTFKDCVSYAIGNTTWTSPATLTMANVQVNGNTFENVANVLRHRVASGVFEFDETNTLDGQNLDAVLLAQYINSDPHSGLTAEQLKNRLVATVGGKEIRVGTDFLVGQNRGWTNNTTFDFGWAVNKANTGLDAVKAESNTTTINALVASLKDQSTEEVLQTKVAKLDQLLFGDDGACAYPESWSKGWMSNAFLTRGASDGAYWNATAMTATKESNPDTIVTIVMEHTDGTVYFVRY